MKFHLYGTSYCGLPVDEYSVTDASGIAVFDDVLIGTGYTLEEVGTPDRYIVPDDQTAAIEWNKVTNKSFDNDLKRGDLKVTKTAEDGLNEGLKFHLYGTSYSGIPVDEYAVTDASGVATFSSILIGTGYTLQEVETPIRYVVPDKQTAAIEWNKVTNKSCDNVLKKWNLTVTKQDVETGSAQGGANLAGAKYGIYKGDELIDTYVTDADGKFTTKYYVCGTDWSIKELDSSEGYLVTPGNEQIGVSPKNYTAEYNSEAMKQYEQVKKGNIAIIKHTDDGQTQIETPEEGAEFAVYLKSAGSYDNAKDSERDYLICDENGFAQTKDLPYGRYAVQQTKGWEGRELLKPFDVFVSENGETYRYLINNANFYSYVKVVKIDSTTGKTIPASGIGFHIEKKLLYQTAAYHNALFVGYDKEGTPRYGALRATRSPYKGDLTGSNKHFSFSMNENPAPDHIHVFESAIDAMSYATMLLLNGKEWKKETFLSLAGVYKTKREKVVPVALERYLKDYPSIKTVHLHLDNDGIGRGAVAGIVSGLQEKYTVLDEPPLHGKDVNDELKIRVGIMREREEIER